MTRVPFTLRIDAAERAALKSLSEIEGRPVNQLLNDAVKSYLGHRGRKEQVLEETLQKLRKYRRRNATDDRAIADFVEAEATLDDPLEGEMIEGQIVGGKFKPQGPVQNKLRKLLSA